MKTKRASEILGRNHVWHRDGICIMSGEAMIACMDTTPEMEECDEIFGNLLAAAPEMLRALKLARKHLYDHASNTEDRAFDLVCLAIEKAQHCNRYV